jgi:DNA-binding transcriptional LysR family regulator
MLDIRRVRVLVEVARRGSVSGAADALSVVPSAVSQQIDALEREVGVQLTQRAGRGIALTSAGRLLARHGEDLLVHLIIAETEIHNLDTLDMGQLRLATFPSAGATLLPGVLAELARAYPGLRLSLLEAEPRESIPALKRHDIDLAIVYDYRSVPSFIEAGLAQRRLLTDPMRLAIPPMHPLAAQDTTKLSQFADSTWIVDRAGMPNYVLTIEACQAAGFQPQIAFSTDDYLLTLRLVSKGLGVSFVPSLALIGLDEDVTFVDLPEPPRREILAAWHSHTTSEAVPKLLSLLTESAANLTAVGNLAAPP